MAAMLFRSQLRLLICLTMGGLVETVRQPPNLGNRTQFVYVREAEVTIGQLVSIHWMDDNKQCTGLFTQEVIRAKAFEFAIDQINKREDLLPNITVGFVQLDDCFNELMALEVGIYLMNNEYDVSLLSHDRYHKPTTVGNSLFSTIVGVLGPMSSGMSIPVSQYLGTFHVPAIALYATANELSDKTKYPYFMRLVPPDFSEEKVIIEVDNFLTTFIHQLAD